MGTRELQEHLRGSQKVSEAFQDSGAFQKVSQGSGKSFKGTLRISGMFQEVFGECLGVGALGVFQEILRGFRGRFWRTQGRIRGSQGISGDLSCVSGVSKQYQEISGVLQGVAEVYMGTRK